MKKFINYLILMAILMPAVSACSSSNDDEKKEVLPENYYSYDDDGETKPHVYEIIYTMQGDNWNNIDIDVSATCVTAASQSEKGVLINDKLCDATTTYSNSYNYTAYVEYNFNSDSIKVCRIKTEGKSESISVNLIISNFRQSASSSKPFNIKVYSDGNLIKEIENKMDNKSYILYQLTCSDNHCEVSVLETKI